MTPEGVHEQKAGRVLLSSVGVVGGGVVMERLKVCFWL